MDIGFNKVLVTGGAGFIGSHIVDRLLEEGYKVRVLDNLSSGDKKNIVQHLDNKSFRFIEADIRNFDAVTKAVKGVDAVIHEAALVSVTKSIEDPLLSNSINVIGTLNLLKACVESKVKRFVFASSCAVYGDTDALPIKEDVLPKPLSPYAADKLAAENYIKVFGKTNDLETVCLRYFNVYGSRQKHGPYSGVISVFVNSFLNNKTSTVYGDGKQTRDFVNVKDVAHANLNALSKKETTGEVFNVCTGKATSINKIFETLQQITDKLEMKPVYKKCRVGDINHSYGDSSKSERKLGFKAKMELKTGLSEVVDWRSKFKN